MKFLLAILLTLPLLCFAQYHDPSLDRLGNNTAILDSDINGWGKTNTDQMLTTNRLMDLGRGQMSLLLDFVTTNIVNQVTNRAGAAQQSWVNMWNGLNIPTNFGTNIIQSGVGSSNSATVIHLGTFNFGGGFVRTFDLDLNMNTYINGSVGSLVRLFIICIVWFIHFKYTFDTLAQRHWESTNQKQMAGTTTSIFGWSLPGPVALIYAGVITALLATILAVIATNGFFHSTWPNFQSMPALLQQISNIPAWPVVTFFVPIPEILSAIMNYALFKYLYSYPLFLTVRMIMFWLVK